MSNIVDMDGMTLPPREYIYAEIILRGWSVEQLADKSSCSVEQLNAVLANEVHITNQIAEGLAVAFGTTIDMWLNLQSAYNRH